MIFILIFVKNYQQNNAINDFSVWPGTRSNPADINRFGSHTGKSFNLSILCEYISKSKNFFNNNIQNGKR